MTTTPIFDQAMRAVVAQEVHDRFADLRARVGLGPQPVRTVAYKRARCDVCGSHAERSRTFTHTPDASEPQYMAVARVMEEARGWELLPVRHARCES